MHSELINFWLFIQAIATTLLITGLGPGIAIAILCDRIRAIGFERISRRALMPAALNRAAASLPRKIWRHA